MSGQASTLCKLSLSTALCGKGRAGAGGRAGWGETGADCWPDWPDRDDRFRLVNS